MILHFALVLAGAVTRPSTKPVHRFYDKPAKIELALATSAAAFDMAQTCHNLAQGGREYWMLQSCAGNVGITLGVLAGQELTAFGMHKLGAHRLERLVRLFSLQGNVRGLVYSRQHGAW